MLFNDKSRKKIHCCCFKMLIGFLFILSVRRYYHVADATVQSRRQTMQLEYPGMARGFLLSQQPNRPSALIHKHKLIVVKYLRIFTTIVPIAEKVLSVQLQANAQMYASLLMRRALRLERDYRLSHRYSSFASVSGRVGGDSTEYADGVIGTFMSRLPVNSPGVALMINSLIKHIIKVSHYYAAEKSKSRADSADISAKTRRTNLSAPTSVGHSTPPTKELLENVVNDVFTYPATKDLLIYTFACIDKLTFYHPIVGQKTDPSGAGTGEFAPYVCDDHSVYESIVESVDSAQLGKILHPLLVPVSSELKLGTEFLPLTRRSLVMSDQKFFFLDAGTDFVLYRAAPGATATAGSAAGGPFGHMLELTKLDEEFAESCLHAAAQARQEYPFPPADPATSGTTAGIAGVDSEGDFAIGESAKSRTKSTRGQPRSKYSDCVAPKVVNHMYDGDFLLLYLARRLKNATVLPRVQLCDAGTGSASVFDAYLLEDHSSSGLSYHQFVEYLVEVVKRDMKLEP